MGTKYDFDYIIIGSGPAGRTAAVNLAKARKRVALVESHDFGGADINTRDLPYIYGLDFAHTFYKLSKNRAFSGQKFHFNFPTLVSEQERIVAKARDNAKALVDDAGVTYIEGFANFLSPNSIAVSGKEYTSKNFILATGCELKTGEISGIENVNYLTPDTAIKIRRLPEFVFIVGGGPTGCEIAEYYAKLGTRVLIMEKANRLLPGEDKEISEEITKYFEDKLKIMVITDSRVVAISQDNVSKSVIFVTDGQEKMVRVDCIVLATGSTPSVDYGLENAKVKYRHTGIVVNRYFQTSAKHIFAIGDVAMKPDVSISSTELSEYEASVLANNIIHKTKTQANYSGFIRSISTEPEIAVVGLNEHDLTVKNQKFKKSIVYLKDLPIGSVAGQEYGFIKILADHGGRILGASIMSPNAKIIAEELALAIRHRITTLEIASTPHPADYYTQAVKLAAKNLVVKK